MHSQVSKTDTSHSAVPWSSGSVVSALIRGQLKVRIQTDPSRMWRKLLIHALLNVGKTGCKRRQCSHHCCSQGHRKTKSTHLGHEDLVVKEPWHCELVWGRGRQIKTEYSQKVSLFLCKICKGTKYEKYPLFVKCPTQLWSEWLYPISLILWHLVII